MPELIQWLTLLAVIGNFIYREYGATRQRKWQMEDREADKLDRAELAKKVDTTATQLASKVDSTATSLAAKVSTQASTLADKVVTASERLANKASGENAKLAQAIEANTAISTQAFKEANQVNQKIASLGIEHNDLQREEQAEKK
jgi:hypothetical protein